MLVDFDMRGQREEVLLWIMDLFGLKLKHLNDGFVFYKHASFQFTMR